MNLKTSFKDNITPFIRCRRKSQNNGLKGRLLSAHIGQEFLAQTQCGKTPPARVANSSTVQLLLRDGSSGSRRFAHRGSSRLSIGRKVASPLVDADEHSAAAVGFVGNAGAACVLEQPRASTMQPQTQRLALGPTAWKLGPSDRGPCEAACLAMARVRAMCN